MREGRGLLRDLNNKRRSVIEWRSHKMPLERECVCVKNHDHPHSLSPELGREVEKRIQGPREKRQEIK